MGSLETIIRKNVCRLRRRITQILTIQSQLWLCSILECWCYINIISRFKWICWFKHWRIRCLKRMFEHSTINGRRFNWRIISWSWCRQRPTSNMGLENIKCRYTNQESRTMRFMLVILNNRNIRRIKLHYQQKLIIILRTTNCWLFRFIW